MRRLFEIICCLLGCVGAITAQDITKLEKIGPVISFTRTENGVTLTCRDNSQVQLTVLASDLIRIRTSFGKAIPSRDHSWAIEKKDWPTARWGVSRDDSISLKTDELEVVVH